MKKLFVGIIIFLSFVFAPHVYAYELGVSSTEEYLGGVYATGEDTISLAIPPNQKSSLAVLYGDFYGDSADLGKIEVSISGTGSMNLTPSSSDLETGDVLSGSGGNYTLTINSASDYYSGTGLFIVTMPNVSSTTTYNVGITAKAYNKNNILISTKNLTIKYVVAVKSTTCDNNYDVSISTSAGTPEKVSELFGTNYAVSTNNETIDVTVTPVSSKTEIYYDKNCNYSDLSSKRNSVAGIKLNYGHENQVCFLIVTECYRQYRDSSNDIDMLIGGIDWYTNLSYNMDIINLNVTRNDNRSKVNTLKTLTISDVSINFNSNLKNYIATVPFKVSSVKINSTLTDPKSYYVSGYGNRTVSLNEGTNDVLIKVKAENGAETTYTIKITREKNDDATLKSLMLNDKEVELQKDVLLYNEYVNNDVVKATIKAEATDSGATVQIDEIKELKEGINKVNITVISASGKKNIYVLNIVRDKLISENSKLKKITIANHNIDFNSNVYEYVVNVDKDENKLDITVETDHPKAKYLIIGNKNLRNNSVIKIKVTAEDDKTVSMYEIKINKNGEFNNFFLIIPFAILLVIAFIVYGFIKKNKNNPSKKLPEDNGSYQKNDNAQNGLSIENVTPLVEEVGESSSMNEEEVSDAFQTSEESIGGAETLVDDRVGNEESSDSVETLDSNQSYDNRSDVFDAIDSFEGNNQ